jgi:hypothetical protein
VKVNFYLELGTRVQDKRVLELLRFPSDSFLIGNEKWTATWWCHGETKRMVSRNRQEILLRIVNEGINELELDFELSDTQHAGMQIVGGSCSLYPSVTAEIWADVPAEHLANDDEESKRKTFGGGKSFREEYRQKYQKPYPTVAEYSVNCEVPDVQSDDALQAFCIEFIRSAMPESLGGIPIFGYGCVYGKCRRQMMLHNLGGTPAWIDQLGDKFENVYPILVGPLATCEGLVASLGGSASLFRIPGGVLSAIVSIPPHEVDSARQNAAVKDWVVIRDLGKLDAPAATLDVIYERKKALPWEAPFVKR